MVINYCKFAIVNSNLLIEIDLEQIVNSIISKSRKLVKERQKLIEENEQLKVQVQGLKEEKSLNSSRIDELLEKQKIQQIAGVFGKEEKRTSLRKIDEVVREVDRCIALLNT